MINLDNLRHHLDKFKKVCKEMEDVFKKAYTVRSVHYPHYDALFRMRADLLKVENPKIVRKSCFRASIPKCLGETNHEKMRAAAFVSHINIQLDEIEKRLEQSLFSIIKEISCLEHDTDASGFIEIHIIIGKTTKFCAGYGPDIQSISLNPCNYGLTLDDEMALIDLFLSLRYAKNASHNQSKQLWDIEIRGHYFDENKNTNSTLVIRPKVFAHTENEAILLCAASGYNFLLCKNRVCDMKIMKQVFFKPWQNGAFDLSDARQDILNPIKKLL